MSTALARARGNDSQGDEPSAVKEPPDERHLAAMHDAIRALREAEALVVERREAYRLAVENAHKVGFSYDRIGRELGVTRQRVARIIRPDQPQPR